MVFAFAAREGEERVKQTVAAKRSLCELPQQKVVKPALWSSSWASSLQPAGFRVHLALQLWIQNSLLEVLGKQVVLSNAKENSPASAIMAEGYGGIALHRRKLQFAMQWISIDARRLCEDVERVPRSCSRAWCGQCVHVVSLLAWRFSMGSSRNFRSESLFAFVIVNFQIKKKAHRVLSRCVSFQWLQSCSHCAIFS